MSTLIVPCVGRKLIDNRPQYLVRHPNGKMLLERSFEGIFPEKYEKIIVVVLKEDSEIYDAKELILNELSKKYPVQIVELEEMTGGPAETVYQAILKEKLSGSIVIKDSDNYVKIPKQMTGNFIAGLNLNEWEKDIHNLRNKSFLILNEQNNILDIIEKQIRSEIIGLGLYGFKHTSEFIKAYKKLDDISYPINKLYISHIISYLIGYSERVFRYISAEEYENWGDERLWKDMQRDYTLYFIDLDNILGKNGILSEQSRNKLSVLQKRGASFIGYTVKDEEYKISALNVLQGAGLQFIKIIYGCPYSGIKEIIASDEELERKVIEL